MTTPRISRGKLTIFEGCDGSGKTTAATDFATATGALLIHFNNLPAMTNISRIYAEGMLPALMAGQDVVFDRCWISEVPYGNVYRGGKDRIGEIHVRMLERLALSLGAVVILCSPPVDAVVSCYRSRREIEFLDNEDQLRAVHAEYLKVRTSLPMFHRNYVNNVVPTFTDIEFARHTLHPLCRKTFGNRDAGFVFVYDGFEPVAETDLHYQWAEASFRGFGREFDITALLIRHGIPENVIYWIHKNDLESFNVQLEAHDRHVYALGEASHAALKSHGIRHHFGFTISDTIAKAAKDYNDVR